MDFEQLRKDMEDGTDGPWLWQDEEECLVGPVQIVARRDEHGGIHILNEADARRIARVPDLERIALAAEKYRKADEAFDKAVTAETIYHTSKQITKAREELFALLTSKDAT